MSGASELQQRRLEELLAQTPAGIGLMADRRWTYVNHEYVRITGRTSAADFIGKTLAESLPEVEPAFSNLLDEVFRTGIPFTGREMKATLSRRDGQPEEAYFDFVYQPIRNGSGQVDRVLIHALEVTDKVVARRAAEDALQRLNLAQAAARIGTWEWDPIHNTQTLSDELHRMFGTSPNDSDIEGIWASRVYVPDQRMVKQRMLEANKTGNFDFEYRYEHPEDGLRWFYCRGGRLPNRTGLLGVVQDITERKRAHEQSERLSAIVSSSDDAIISKDLRGIVTSWNAAAERMFGYTAEEMLGKPILTIIPPELQDDETRILGTIARGERIEHFETVRVNKNGQRIDVSLTVSPVRDESGRIIGAAKIARDITQRKRAEYALHTAERLASVGRLAATVAHEINNPLEALTNLIFLARNVAPPGEVETYLTAAQEELDRVSHISRQTLGFYRETRGSCQIKLGSIVTSMLSVFSSRARNKGVTIRPEVKRDPDIWAIPGEIRQLVANLVSNSIDAVGTGGQVRVRVAAAVDWSDPRRDGVRLTVGDNGTGIAAEIRRHLFEPFVTSKQEVGTGLGLWVCKSIVEKHDGSIRLKSSTTPGRSWTAFSIFLPARSIGVTSMEALRHAV